MRIYYHIKANPYFVLHVFDVRKYLEIGGIKHELLMIQSLDI